MDKVIVTILSIMILATIADMIRIHYAMTERFAAASRRLAERDTDMVWSVVAGDSVPDGLSLFWVTRKESNALAKRHLQTDPCHLLLYSDANFMGEREPLRLNLPLMYYNVTRPSPITVELVGLDAKCEHAPAWIISLGCDCQRPYKVLENITDQ